MLLGRVHLLVPLPCGEEGERRFRRPGGRGEAPRHPEAQDGAQRRGVGRRLFRSNASVVVFETHYVFVLESAVDDLQNLRAVVGSHPVKVRARNEKLLPGLKVVGPVVDLCVGLAFDAQPLFVTQPVSLEAYPRARVDCEDSNGDLARPTPENRDMPPRPIDYLVRQFLVLLRETDWRHKSCVVRRPGACRGLTSGVPSSRLPFSFPSR